MFLAPAHSRAGLPFVPFVLLPFCPFVLFSFCLFVFCLCLRHSAPPACVIPSRIVLTQSVAAILRGNLATFMYVINKPKRNKMPSRTYCSDYVEKVRLSMTPRRVLSLAALQGGATHSAKLFLMSCRAEALAVVETSLP